MINRQKVMVMKNSNLMMILIIAAAFAGCKSQSQSISTETVIPYEFTQDSLSILNVLSTQQSAWNEADIPKFMEGYWKDDALTFIGGSGVTYGWQNTLNNYLKGYPDPDAMGQLSFDIIKVKSLGSDAAQVIGKYTLVRKEDKPTGHFSLVFQKINGVWLLTSDMTANTPVMKAE